jgi:hypothetical protein
MHLIRSLTTSSELPQLLRVDWPPNSSTLSSKPRPKPFFTRFGIHVGEAVVGNLGSTERDEPHGARRVNWQRASKA